MSAGSAVCSVPLLNRLFLNTCDTSKTEAEKAGKGNIFDILNQIATSPAPVKTTSKKERPHRTTVGGRQ